MEIVIGIDIGGTYTKVGLINESGKSLNEISFETQEGHPEFENFIETLKKKIEELLGRNKEFKVKVLIGPKELGEGKGRSKQEAEQEAAKTTLQDWNQYLKDTFNLEEH